MVREQIEKTMKKALTKFAEKEGVDPREVAFFIHTKPSEADPTLRPKYFYSVGGKIIKDEEGRVKNLRFTQDILGKKFDLLGMEAMAEQFLANYYKNISQEVDTEPMDLYVAISFDQKWSNKLRFMLLKNNELFLLLERGSEVLKCSDYNEKEEVECNPQEWKEYLAEKALYSPLEWRERTRMGYSLAEIFGE